MIGFMDTGVVEIIMNPKVLPVEWWKPHERIFISAADQPFVTYLISKPRIIQFFPRCSVRTMVLGSKLLGKVIVVGFDLYTKDQQLRILPEEDIQNDV